jgi:hypothetical protein
VEDLGRKLGFDIFMAQLQCGHGDEAVEDERMSDAYDQLRYALQCRHEDEPVEDVRESRASQPGGSFNAARTMSPGKTAANQRKCLKRGCDVPRERSV